MAKLDAGVFCGLAIVYGNNISAPPQDSSLKLDYIYAGLK